MICEVKHLLFGSDDEQGAGECRARSHDDFSAKRPTDTQKHAGLQSGETATHTAKERPR